MQLETREPFNFSTVWTCILLDTTYSSEMKSFYIFNSKEEKNNNKKQPPYNRS